jgi:hypothetical protein
LYLPAPRPLYYVGYDGDDGYLKEVKSRLSYLYLPAASRPIQKEEFKNSYVLLEQIKNYLRISCWMLYKYKKGREAGLALDGCLSG